MYLCKKNGRQGYSRRNLLNITVSAFQIARPTCVGQDKCSVEDSFSGVGRILLGVGRFFTFVGAVFFGVGEHLFVVGRRPWS